MQLIPQERRKEEEETSASHVRQAKLSKAERKGKKKRGGGKPRRQLWTASTGEKRKKSHTTFIGGKKKRGKDIGAPDASSIALFDRGKAGSCIRVSNLLEKEGGKKRGKKGSWVKEKRPKIRDQLAERGEKEHPPKANSASTEGKKKGGEGKSGRNALVLGSAITLPHRGGGGKRKKKKESLRQGKEKDRTLSPPLLSGRREEKGREGRVRAARKNTVL